MISVLSNNLSLKYKKFTQSGYKDIEIRNFEFVTKTQFLYTLGHTIILIELQYLQYFSFFEMGLFHLVF